jgi:hypothetical protein
VTDGHRDKQRVIMRKGYRVTETWRERDIETQKEKERDR